MAIKFKNKCLHQLNNHAEQSSPPPLLMSHRSFTHNINGQVMMLGELYRPPLDLPFDSASTEVVCFANPLETRHLKISGLNCPVLPKNRALHSKTSEKLWLKSQGSTELALERRGKTWSQQAA